MEYRSLFEEALESWEDARNGVIGELENIPEEHFDFRPAERVRSVRELAIHILEVAVMMTEELTRADTNFGRAPWPELLKMHAADVYKLHGKKEIVEYMKDSLQDGIDRFREAGELHMLQLIRRFDGKLGTRLAWFHHAVAQEMYHRGQLTTYARMIGLTPALTKLIES